MAYVAVKGGEQAIEASLALIAARRLQGGKVLDVQDLMHGMSSLLDQVMSEASLFGEGPAALAVKQAEGSPEEAVFLLRAFRSTLPRAHYSTVIDTGQMFVERRISAAFKDIPGGQILGPSLDYSHRLLDFALWDEHSSSPIAPGQKEVDRLDAPESRHGEPGVSTSKARFIPKVTDYLREQGLLPTQPHLDEPPKDITKHSLEFPASRSERLQVLSRGQTGAVIALGYASLRGYGQLHPTIGELRVGRIAVHVPDPLGSDAEEDAYYIGEIRVTEVESLIPVSVPRGQGRQEIQFDLGYGFCFGHNESKAIAMSILDQGLEHPDPRYPTQNEEFVLMHVDTVEATGFISHLKLPHYVTFQSKLDVARSTRAARATRPSGSGEDGE